jgi:hypothetical protein
MKSTVMALCMVVCLGSVAEASHGSGRRPDRFTCFIPGLPEPQTGFAVINPPLDDGSFLFSSIYTRSYETFTVENDAGGLDHYSSFGAGWCLGITNDAEIRETNFDYVRCQVPGYDDIDVGPAYVKVREYKRINGTDGSRSRYFPFGSGYCVAGRFAPETIDLPDQGDIEVRLPESSDTPPCEGIPCVAD